MNGIKVEMRGTHYIDFTIASDPHNIYRYTKGDTTFHKLFGFGSNNYGKAVRGNERKKIEALAKTVLENNLPFAILL